MPRKAIATLALGSRYAETFTHAFRPGWEAYCRRHGVDLIVISEPIDRSDRAQKRSPAWQKLLIHRAPGLAGYDQIAWVDCDIAIAPDAPDIFRFVPEDRVGAVNDHATPSREDHRLVTERAYRQWDAMGVRYIPNLTAREFYASVGIACDFEDVVQTGVFVFSPARHAAILENTYARYEDPGDNGLNHEMRFFSYELIQAGVMEWLSVKFNMMWTCYQALHYPFLEFPETLPGRWPAPVKRKVAQYMRPACVRAAFANNHFLHFAGGCRDFLHLPAKQ